jgi:hypothetical protein
MINNFTIITVPQWAVFVAITAVIYGWVEKKKSFRLLGAAILAGLGIFSAWAIYIGALLPESLFDTTEIYNGEELFMPDEVPTQGRLLPFYWGLVASGGIAIAALIAGIFNHRLAKPLVILMCIVALLMFFGILGVARM